MLKGKNILLILTGSIASYKSLFLIRLLKEKEAIVRCVMTSNAKKFITPLSVASLSENKVYTDLFSLKDETEMGHIKLARESDLILVVPASADFISKIATGQANDLATAILLATNKPIVIAPSMNIQMWDNFATVKNVSLLRKEGLNIMEPSEGSLACGEEGYGRMKEPHEILSYIETTFFNKPLNNIKALITAGPTKEPIDPVRYISNNSSGIQSYCIAESLSNLGAKVILVSGPTHLKPPQGIHKLINVVTADDMLKACTASLPVDVAICAAAVTDWKVASKKSNKIKKGNSNIINLTFKENPDILFNLSNHPKRPKMIIGFAAETQNIIKNAKQKLSSKKCDFIVANDVSQKSNVFGNKMNRVHIIGRNNFLESWPKMKKEQISEKLAKKISVFFNS